MAGLAPLALGSMVMSRFDFWPAALVALALAALLWSRIVLSAVLLGTAVAAKLWPVILVPLVIVWLIRNRGKRAAAVWSAVAAAVVAAWFLPFAVLSPGGVEHSFREQLSRPLQIESLGGAILLAAHQVFPTTLHMVHSYGSQNLIGSGAHFTTVATTLVEVAAYITIVVIFARGRAGDEQFLLAGAAVVVVAIAFGKVFSPQFLIWLIPLVPLVRGRRSGLVVPLFASALVLTQLYFPGHYWELVDFRWQQTVNVLARDLVVVALAVVLAWPREDHEGLAGRSNVS